MSRGEEAVNAHSYLRALEKEKEEQQRVMKEKILSEKLIPVSISPMYRKRIGQNLPLSIGMETITIPVDGNTYKIKESFAELLKNHIHQINKEELRSDGQWRGNKGNVYPTGEIPGT